MNLVASSRRRLLRRLAFALASAAVLGTAWTIGLLSGLRADPDGMGALDALDRRLGAYVRAREQRPRSGLHLRTAGTSGREWPTYGGDYSNSRYSPLREIDGGNIRRLRVAWVHQTEGGDSKQVTTPLVVDGVIYYTAPINMVIAVDARSGAELWRYEYKMSTVPLMCCGMINRGVAVYGEQVYFAAPDAKLVSLDRRTGKLVWQVAVADPAEGYSQTMAPLAVDGKIILGSSGGEFGVRGFVDAYDAATGARLWRFWTVPSPEDGGWWGRWVTTTPDGDPLPRDIAREKADSAKFADAWKRGGGAAWMTPAYDPRLGLLYVGTGDPAPKIDGASRPGDNLYTCSIVALDIRSGKLRWYYQLTPHDLWGRDAANAIVLFNTKVGGAAVPALAQASKLGWVYVLDRRTGKRILRSSAFVPQQNVFSAPTPDGTLIYPASVGGNQWAPSAHSPRTGWLYMLGRHDPSLVRVKPGEREAGKNFAGGARTRVVDGESPNQVWGTVSAIDLATGEVAWQRAQRGYHAWSGMLATGGDLIFFGKESFINAYDARTGRTLWRFQTGGRVGGAPISFEVDGRQHIAVATASALFSFALGAPENAVAANAELAAE